MVRLKWSLIKFAAVLMAATALHAAAETQAVGRDFNHMTTGFPLSGGHATAPCDTCHVGGVFKGTPKNCDGCHALGKRVVATPKSTSHIVTNAPCESCHFNTSTFLGARFNHGTATPGNCSTCHNGRIAAGKPAKHVATTFSCDQCHRSSSWIPASWNHNGVTQDCQACHNAAGPGRNYTNTAAHSMYVVMGINTCNSCHNNYWSFYSAMYNHSGVGGTACQNCHDNPAYAAGVKQKVTQPIHSIAVTLGIGNCQSCHKSYVSFVGSRFDHLGVGACQTCHTAAYNPTLRSVAANHVPFPATAVCTSCHYSTASWAAESMQHGLVAGTPCTTCHLSTSPYLGRMRKKGYGHQGMVVGQDCSTCHGFVYSSWGN